MNRRKLQIILLLCLVAPWLATVSYLHYAKRAVKKEVKHRMMAEIDQDELVLLTFATAEIDSLVKWEHAKEFEYRNQMYDVVNFENKGDSTSFWCWHDAEESQLNKKLNGLVANLMQSNPFEKDKQQKAQVFLKKLYCSQYEAHTLFKETASIAVVFDYHRSLLSAMPNPPAPPPRFV